MLLASVSDFSSVVCSSCFAVSTVSKLVSKVSLLSTFSSALVSVVVVSTFCSALAFLVVFLGLTSFTSLFCCSFCEFSAITPVVLSAICFSLTVTGTSFFTGSDLIILLSVFSVWAVFLLK